MITNGPKRCIDCVYCEVPIERIYKEIDTEYFCVRPESYTGDENNVTGKLYRRSCVFMRGKGGLCGEKAKLFESKVPWINQEGRFRSGLLWVVFVGWVVLAVIPGLIMLGLIDKSWLMGLMR